MASKEVLEAPPATPAVETSKTTTASMVGPSTEASFNLGGNKNAEGAEQSPEIIAEASEKPEAAVDRLVEEEARVSGELSAFDKKAEASGKPLENSEFLDRASLATRAMSLQMLGMQKKLELAQASPDAETEAGKAEVARLNAERNAAIEQFKGRADEALAGTAERFINGFSEDNNEIFLISSKRLAEGMVHQIKLRKELEGVGLLGNEAAAKAFVREAAAEEGAVPAKNSEDVVAQLRPAGVAEQEAGPTEQLDPELREALLIMAKALAEYMAKQKGPEKGLFDRMLDNLRRLEGADTKEAGAQEGIKEILGVGKDEKSPQDVTGAALDKFLLAMADSKKGKNGGLFKTLLSKLGQFAFLKKIKDGLAKGIDTKGMNLQGLTKLGAAGLGSRLASLMAPQFGRIDLSKKVATPANDLEGARSQLQGINARIDAYDKANPGKTDSAESKAMEAEYRPVRATFDRLRGVTDSEFADAPKAAAPEAAPVTHERSDKAIVPGTPEAEELLRAVRAQQEQDAYENKVLDEMNNPENAGKGFEISPGIIQKIKEREEDRLKAKAEAEPAASVESAPVEQ